MLWKTNVVTPPDVWFFRARVCVSREGHRGLIATTGCSAPSCARFQRLSFNGASGARLTHPLDVMPSYYVTLYGYYLKKYSYTGPVT